MQNIKIKKKVISNMPRDLERKREYSKEYEQRPEVKERKKEYRSTPEFKHHQREYQREYYQRPGAKEHQREYYKTPQRQQYCKEYLQRPEVIEHYKKRLEEYLQRPEVKKRNKENSKKYSQMPQRKQYIKEYYQQTEVKEHLKEYQQRPEAIEYQKEYSKKIRIEVLTHYGNGELRCVNPNCLVSGGCTDIRALQLDHINGGGCKHRREIRGSGGINLYRWLQENNYPEGYQTLCANCNWIKKVVNKENKIIYKNTIFKSTLDKWI